MVAAGKRAPRGERASLDVKCGVKIYAEMWFMLCEEPNFSPFQVSKTIFKSGVSRSKKMDSFDEKEQKLKLDLAWFFVRLVIWTCLVWLDFEATSQGGNRKLYIHVGPGSSGLWAQQFRD